MSIKSLPKYKDLRGILEKKSSYDAYPISKKEWIVIHHSLTVSGSAEAYNNYHLHTLGWKGGIGYHIVIEKDGTIKQCHDLNLRSYHVGNSNTKSIGICLTGDFRKGKEKPTQAQKDSLYLLVKEIKKEVPSISKVIGHQECPGYSWKNCPGDNWNYKDVIKGVGVSVSKPVETKPSTTKPVENLPGEYAIQEGDTFWSIANKHDGLSVIELQELNPSINPKDLKIGDKIRLAKSAPNKYKIKSGDTLWGIARAYSGIEVNDLTKANPGIDFTSLKVGSEITIPGGSAAPEPKNPYAGKRAEAKVNVRFYSKPSWEDRDAAGTLSAGLGFEIVDKIKVGNGHQFKVKNTKGAIYYITANEKFIRVE